MEPLFFKPIPFKTIWGGESIKRYYGYDWMPDGVGQAWAFAAQDHDSPVCQNGEYKGRTLRDLWDREPQLFGDTDRVFPVIISLLCPCDDLSIQVHPDDEHARALGYPYGKNEAWYFLEADDDASIVFGHKVHDEAELRDKIAKGEWDGIVDHLKIRKDDFVYVPAGTLHACGKGVIAYEVQQSTDVTYRFYDYDRTDAEGNKRPLQLEEAIGSLHYGDDCATERYTCQVVAKGGCLRATYIDSPSFKIEKLVVTDDSYTLDDGTYHLVSVMRGAGKVNGIDVHVGHHFLAPKDVPVEISGNLTCMMTTA